MKYLEEITQNLEKEDFRPAIIEVHEHEDKIYSRRALKQLVWDAQNYFLSQGVSEGDRVAILAKNSAQWVAVDLALSLMRVVIVPLYVRQEFLETKQCLERCNPKIILLSSEEDVSFISELKKLNYKLATFKDVFSIKGKTWAWGKTSQISALIFTSGTSGLLKGAMISFENFDFMLQSTVQRLTETIRMPSELTRVFHYLPFCFMGSRLMLWSLLFKGTPVFISMDLEQLKNDLKKSEPHYFLSVPAVLEKIKRGAEEKMSKAPNGLKSLYNMFLNRDPQSENLSKKVILFFINLLIIKKIRRLFGSNIQFIICGSAMLNPDTQDWFEKIGIKILQVYGLTETTGIIAMDTFKSAKSGTVGKVIEGGEIQLSAEGELLYRGPNVFLGYWENESETQSLLKEGWLHTGDQAEIDADGRIKIIGRLKNIIVMQSGHNVSPENIELNMMQYCPELSQVVIVGHEQPYLCALIEGNVQKEKVDSAIEKINMSLPHYKKIRKWTFVGTKFSSENGLLTSNLKLKRKNIEFFFSKEINEMYNKFENSR